MHLPAIKRVVLGYVRLMWVEKVAGRGGDDMGGSAPPV